MQQKFKPGSLIFTKWSTCMIVAVKEFKKYMKEDSADGKMNFSASFWNVGSDDEHMIHIQILHDRRKPMNNHSFSNTFWIPQSELEIHSECSDKDGHWRVVQSS